MTGQPGFTLRDAHAADASEIARLVHELAVFEKLEDQARGTAEDFVRQLFGPSPKAFAMLAERQGRAVGFALWFYNFSTFRARPGLYVEDVFVEPGHRGAGIGKAMFRAMAQRAVAEGCARMEWAVLDWNQTAIDFYRKLGAVGMTEWTVQRLDTQALAALAGAG